MSRPIEVVVVNDDDLTEDLTEGEPPTNWHYFYQTLHTLWYWKDLTPHELGVLVTLLPYIDDNGLLHVDEMPLNDCPVKVSPAEIFSTLRTLIGKNVVKRDDGQWWIVTVSNEKEFTS